MDARGVPGAANTPRYPMVSIIKELFNELKRMCQCVPPLYDLTPVQSRPTMHWQPAADVTARALPPHGSSMARIKLPSTSTGRAKLPRTKLTTNQHLW